MNKITEYFENLDTKNTVMLVLSVLIVCFIAIYYLNDYFDKKESVLFREKINILKKIRKINSLNNKIMKIKNRNKQLKTEYKDLNSDLIYLLSVIDSSNVLKIDNKKFLKILHSYIKSGTGVNASFDIDKTKKPNKYLLNISGWYNVEKFFDFAYFLKQIESPKAIVTVEDINISKKKDKVFYDMSVNIWSFK